MNKYRWLLPLMLIYSVTQISFALDQDSSIFLYKKTFKLLDDTKIDSALITIRQAYSYGLSDDSLFYAWAQIYSVKGALDTALALSLACKVSQRHPLYVSVLKQRFFLYGTTGQGEKAALYLDSLKSLPSYNMKKMIPQISCSFKGGAYENETTEASILPYRFEYDYPEERLRTTVTGDLGLKWSFPLNKKNSFEPSIYLNASQYHPYSPFVLINTFDSCDFTMSAKLRYYMLSGKLSAGYECNRAVNYMNDIFFSNRFNIYTFTLLKKGYVFGEAGYSYELKEHTHSWYGFLFGSREWTNQRSNAISVSISGLYKQEQVFRDHRTLNMVYVDGFTFFTDSTFEKILPPPLEKLFFIQDDYIDKHKYPVYAVVPQNSISSNIKAIQNFIGRFGLIAGVDLEYNFNWFPNEYIWLDLLYDYNDIPNINGTDTKILALNRNDKKKYWVKDISIPEKIIDLDTVPIVLHRKRRIDQSISANAIIKKKFKDVLEIGFNGTIRRTFSTLGENAPVDIPVWSYMLMISTTLQFNPAGKLR